MQTQNLSDTIPPLDFRDLSATALLVIDFQYSDAARDRGWVKACDKVEPGSMDYYVDRLERLTIPAIRKLLDAFRTQGRPVVHLALGSDYRDLRDCPARFRDWTRAMESASGVQDMWWTENPDYAFRTEVRPLREETIIRKTTQGAFNGSEIDAVLRRMDIRNLVCTGVVTSCCVETTARDAADRGYGCLLVSEACADCDQDLHDSALRNFGLYFGKVAERAEDAIALIQAFPSKPR